MVLREKRKRMLGDIIGIDLKLTGEEIILFTNVLGLHVWNFVWSKFQFDLSNFVILIINFIAKLLNYIIIMY